MKFIKVIILWLVSLFATYLVANLVFLYAKPIPNFAELTKLQGEIVDYSLWRKTVGKGSRCDIVLSLDLGVEGEQDLRLGCSDVNKNLEHRIGEEIQFWTQTDKWYFLGKTQKTIYHLQVGSDVFVDYAIKTQQDADREPFRVISIVLAIAVVVMLFFSALKETLHLFLGEGAYFLQRNHSKLSGTPLFKVSKGLNGDILIKSVIDLKSKFPLTVLLIMSIGILWFASQFFGKQPTLWVVFFLMGMLCLFLFFSFWAPPKYSINPKGCLSQMEELGPINKLQLYVYRGNVKTAYPYFLIADCEDGQFPMFCEDKLEPLEEIQKSVSEYLKIDTPGELVETNNISEVMEGTGKHFGFLFETPGLILIGMTGLGVIAGVVG